MNLTVSCKVFENNTFDMSRREPQLPGLAAAPARRARARAAAAARRRRRAARRPLPAAVRVRAAGGAARAAPGRRLGAVRHRPLAPRRAQRLHLCADISARRRRVREHGAVAGAAV